MSNRQHIHTPHDGRGRRDVFVNGRLVYRVIYADTKRGFVRVLGKLIKLDKYKKRTLWKTLRGDVEVRKQGAAEVAEFERHNAGNKPPQVGLD